MQTIELPREEWARALHEFTDVHEGWLVSLDVLSPELGAQTEFTAVPLLGVAAEPPERGDTISIAVARSASDEVTHIVHTPKKLWLERTDKGADVALEIDAADGTQTILRMKAVHLPEAVDGEPGYPASAGRGTTSAGPRR